MPTIVPSSWHDSGAHRTRSTSAVRTSSTCRPQGNSLDCARSSAVPAMMTLRLQFRPCRSRSWYRPRLQWRELGPMGHTWLTRLRIGTHSTTCRGATSRGRRTTTTAKMTTPLAPQQEGRWSTVRRSPTGKIPSTVLVVDTRIPRPLTNEVAAPTAADHEAWTGEQTGPRLPVQRRRGLSFRCAPCGWAGRPIRAVG